MTILILSYFLIILPILYVSIFKIKNIILGLCLGNSIWIIMFLIYFFSNPPLARDESDLELIYPVLIVSVIFSIVRSIKFYKSTIKHKQINELNKMKIKDM